MPSDVESPMYATAWQEVRVAGAALGDTAFGDLVACAGEVVDGAAGAWCVKSLISAGALAEDGGNPLLSAPVLITPPRPAPSSARTLSAATEATPAATRCRRRRR